MTRDSSFRKEQRPRAVGAEGKGGGEQNPRLREGSAHGPWAWTAEQGHRPAGPDILRERDGAGLGEYWK